MDQTAKPRREKLKARVLDTRLQCAVPRQAARTRWEEDSEDEAEAGAGEEIEQEEMEEQQEDDQDCDDADYDEYGVCIRLSLFVLPRLGSTFSASREERGGHRAFLALESLLEL
jgi:hypothetical protein